MPTRTWRNKRKVRKSLKRRNRKQHGGLQPNYTIAPNIAPMHDPIRPEDILFRTPVVCILRPEVKKGILVFSRYTQPVGMPSLCETGLKTGDQLRRNGVNFGRSIYHNCIFFRAPYLSNAIDYSTIDREIASSFGPGVADMPNLVWIRIDPEQTMVYSSDIRDVSRKSGSDLEIELNKSRKTMPQYLQIIAANAAIPVPHGYRAMYDLFTGEKKILPEMNAAAGGGGWGSAAGRRMRVLMEDSRMRLPLNQRPINENSEVLVHLPHLTPNYFVKCT